MSFTNVASAEQAAEIAGRLLAVIAAARATDQDKAQGCR